MRRVMAIIAAMALLLCSCGARSYVDISPHIESGIARDPGGGLTASNYAELKNAIIYLVEQSSEQGSISLVGYSGQVEEDLGRACSEVTDDEPIGAYGVEYMSYSSTKVLANYEVTISISYSRTPEELASVERVGGPVEYRDAVLDALMDSRETLTVETPYYSADRFDSQSTVQNIIHENPLLSACWPTVSEGLYPSEGLRRIVELKIDYGMDADELASRREDLERAARELTLEGDSGEETDDAETVRRLVRNLCERSDFLPEREDDLSGEVTRDETFTAHGALVEGKATSEGYALALSALCSLGAVDCRIVSGRWDGILHYWNLVRVGGDWYHVDAALCERYGEDAYLLKTDEEIGDALKWNTASYPAADGESITFAAEEIPVFEPTDAENS